MAVQPGHRIPETLLAAANVILQAQSLNQRREQQERDMQLRFAAQEELLKHRAEVVDLKEKALALGTQREERLAKGQEEKLKQGSRAISLRESIAAKKAATGPTALNALRTRRLQLQLIEDDAALRMDADPSLQMFSDTQRLVSEKNRIESLVNQRISSFAAKPDDPEIKAMQGQVSAIDKELLGRAKYKRDTLLEAGVPTTLDMAKQYLPDMPDADEQPTAPQPNPTTAPVPVSGFSFDRAIKGALGQDAEYTPEAAISGFKAELQRVRGEDPSGGKAKLFKQQIYQDLIKQGVKNTDAVLKMQNWGL